MFALFGGLVGMLVPGRSVLLCAVVGAFVTFGVAIVLGRIF